MNVCACGACMNVVLLTNIPSYPNNNNNNNNNKAFIGLQLEVFLKFFLDGMYIVVVTTAGIQLGLQIRHFGNCTPHYTGWRNSTPLVRYGEKSQNKQYNYIRRRSQKHMHDITEHCVY